MISVVAFCFCFIYKRLSVLRIITYLLLDRTVVGKETFLSIPLSPDSTLGAFIADRVAFTSFERSAVLKRIININRVKLLPHLHILPLVLLPTPTLPSLLPFALFVQSI